MPFKLTEYVRAETHFFDRAVDALTEARGGILSMARRESRARISTSRLALEDGSTVDFDPLTAAAEMTIGKDDIIAGRVDAVISMADEAAGQFHEALERAFFENITRLTAATGNQIDASGKNLNDAIYELFETLELTFEEDGSISKGFAIVASPEMAERLREAEATITEEQKKRLDELIEKKRKEFFARRRRRKLP